MYNFEISALKVNVPVTLMNDCNPEPSEKERTSQTDSYLVILSSKTYVFEDKSTKY